MNISKLAFLVVITLFFTNSYSQEYNLTGRIFDLKTNNPLPFVTIKVSGENTGSTSDDNGNYILKLSNGLHTVIFTYIGYFSDTAIVNIDGGNATRDIYLEPSEIITEGITVIGEDPAYEIIRKAIQYKKKFQDNLNEYEFTAYSKLVIRSNRSPISESPADSASKESDKLAILGILESETKGYFKKPDLEKQIVKAKRETANITRGFALPLIVNFYDEKVDLGEKKVPGPVADDAFDNYEYKLIGTTSLDSTLIYVIEITNTSNLSPQFYGTVYIADSIFSMVKIDLNTNDAASLRAIDQINFKQKFTSYTDAKKNIFWMPTDVQIFAGGSFAGLIKFDAEAYTIVSSYELNKKAPPGIFDEYIVKVLPGAEKDSSYWGKNQLIKNSSEEKKAYEEIAKDEKEKEHKITLGLTTINFGKHLSSSPLSYYHFNRVEGNHLEFNLDYRSDLRRDVADGYFGYGFSDKKMKYNLSYTRRFLKDRSLRVSGSIFRELRTLSYNLFGLAELYNSFKGLLDKKDNYDYFYSSGYNIGVTSSYIPQFRVGIEYDQQKQTTAYKNTNFSIRKSDVEFSQNPPINDAFIRRIGLNFRINPNKYKYIDWGDGNESRFRVTDFPTLDISYQYSGKDFLNSTYDFRKYSAILYGENYVSTFLDLTYNAGFEYYNGSVPYQELAFFNSNTGGINLFLSFKTMQYQEYLGDKLFFLNLENNFGKLLWGNIPFIKKFDLIGFYNVGRVTITDENYDLAAFKDFSETNGIFQEAGFGINGILDIFRVDFAWRLNNYRSGDNFNIVFSIVNF